VDLDINVDEPIPTSVGAPESWGRTRERRLETEAEEILVRVEDVSKTFTVGREKVHAVQSVSFEIPKGTTYGLVGESGSGKSTVSRAVLGLTSIDSGRVVIDGTDIHAMSDRQLRPLRRKMQMVFQ